jgi:hypothetical protein
MRPGCHAALAVLLGCVLDNVAGEGYGGADCQEESGMNGDRCQRESDGVHRWTYAEPPEWMDTSDWDRDAWRSWYDETERTCYSCGMTDD